MAVVQTHYPRVQAGRRRGRRAWSADGLSCAAGPPPRLARETCRTRPVISRLRSDPVASTLLCLLGWAFVWASLFFQLVTIVSSRPTSLVRMTTTQRGRARHVLERRALRRRRRWRAEAGWGTSATAWRRNGSGRAHWSSTST